MENEYQTKLELKITGSEEELRGYLNAAKAAVILSDINIQCQRFLKEGHRFSNADEALLWVLNQAKDVE